MRPRLRAASARAVAYFDTSMLLEHKPTVHTDTPGEHAAQPPRATTLTPSRAADQAAASRLLAYLPVAFVATGLVIVLPAALVAALVPHRGIAMTIASAVVAVAVSLAIATGATALWKRQPYSRDVIFADLMLWCWWRRYRTERRLSQARELFESARRAGPRVNIELLLGLSRLLQARDSHLHGHSQRVARHAARIARAMGLSEQETAKIKTAAEVHDVGKVYTPREIINNPRRLTPAEYEIVKQHAACGAEMLTVVGDPEITAMVRHHHERIDGRGYPDGLAGSAIPLGARIIAVADTFDAISSERAYRPAMSQKAALDTLDAEAGAQLDAEAVAMFKQGYSARRSVAWYAFGVTSCERAFAALQSLASNVGVGGASVATLVPALGAAGALAVSPGLFRVSRDAQPAAGSSALLQPLTADGADGGAGAGSPGEGAAGGVGDRSPGSRSDAPRVRAGIDPPTRTRRTFTGGSPAASAPTPAGVGAGAGAGAGGADGSTGAGGGNGSGQGSTPPVAKPPLLPPRGEAPKVPTPPIPRIAGPKVTTPAVTLPSVGTPTVSTPVVTVPSVTTPSVGWPGVSVGWPGVGAQ
jgi:putative nucleotidyltransferase with HDIG domain